jgi:hypothetical protein
LGLQRGANAPHHFFFSAELKRGKKILIFSQRLFRWCKDRENEKPAFCGTQSRDI